MATRKLRAKLIPADAVDDRFDARAIENLARDAKLPADADLDYFSCAVRSAVQDYLADVRRPLPSEVRDAIEHLGKRLRRALRAGLDGLDMARDAWAGLPPAAHDYLEANMPESRLPLPTPDDLLDPQRGPALVRLLYGICYRGAAWKEGRLRPGGKQSRPRLVPEVTSPLVRPGHPRNDAEFMLGTRLAIIYFKMTGKRAPRTARHGKLGPFACLISQVFDLLGSDDILNVDAVRLVNEMGSYVRRSKERRLSANTP